MKNQFTKGPWDLSQQKSFIVKRDSKSNFTQESTIAEVYETPDAHLISAAPDMYEALANLENDDGSSMPESAWDLVQNALKKARGEK